MSCADSSSIQPAPYMTITSTAKDIPVTGSVVDNSGLHNYYYSHYNRNPSTIMQYNPNNLNMSNGIFTNGNNNCNIQNGVDMSYFPFLNPSCSNTQYDESSSSSSSLHPWATTAAAAIAAAAAYMPQQNSFSEGILAPTSLLINSPPTQTQQQLYYSNLASDSLSPTNNAHNITNGCGMLMSDENTNEMLNSYAALQSHRLLINEHNHPITINNSNVSIRTPSTTGIESWNNISRTSPSLLYQNITNDSLCSSSSSTSSSVASTSQQDDYTNMLVNGNNNFNRQQQYKWMQVKRPISKFSGL